MFRPHFAALLNYRCFCLLLILRIRSVTSKECSRGGHGLFETASTQRLAHEDHLHLQMVSLLFPALSMPSQTILNKPADLLSPGSRAEPGHDRDVREEAVPPTTSSTRWMCARPPTSFLPARYLSRQSLTKRCSQSGMRPSCRWS
ncbi:hypothetical protein C8J56DRAFT_134378 [Mycena floridula]|nr:hypothetical protein C8J56DRAFT_134378 [Mycena floridula]